MKLTKDINPRIFREYDLRGLDNIDLNEDVAYTIGKSYGTYIQKQGHYKAIIGHDNRLSSPLFSVALIKGITETGVGAVDLGLVTTPMYYFAKIYYNIPTGIMITASHNPKEYNGFKISLNEIGRAYGSLIESFRDFTLKGRFKTDKTAEMVNGNIKEAYLDNLKKSISLGDRKIKVVVDCGNGTGSIIIKDVLDMFDIDYELLYCDSDPEFPNHVSDPAESKNMLDLAKQVKKVQADFGIGIDGDADRVGVVDENGKYITPDLMMLIIYRSMAKTMKKKKALFDVKCSRSLIEGLKELKLKPIMNRTGAVYCHKKASEDGIEFGGEYSGHLFFNDRYQGFDDGIYGALRLIEILSKTDKKFSELLEGINKYYSTEEIRIKVTDDNKFNIVDSVKEYCDKNKYKYLDIDGIRVEFDNSWALIRASNTGPNLTVRFEASTIKELDKIQKEFIDVINEQIKIHS